MAGYICAIGIALIFMLFMDGQIGVMMLSFLLLMPLLPWLALPLKTWCSTGMLSHSSPVR